MAAAHSFQTGNMCTQLTKLRVQQATISSPRDPRVAVPTDPRGAGWLGADLLLRSIVLEQFPLQ